MSESEIILAVMVALLFLIAWMQEREIRRLRLAGQESDAWADRWEELAQQAAEEAERIAQRHARLQALYANLVRAQLAANSWIVVRKRDAERDALTSSMAEIAIALGLPESVAVDEISATVASVVGMMIDADKEVAALVAEVERLQAAWMPVASALPDNNVRVLAVMATPRPIVITAWYTRARALRISDTDFDSYDDECVYDAETDARYVPEGWYEDCESGNIYYRVSDAIIYWMALPEPPLDGNR